MVQLKVAFVQKVLIHLSFPQTDEPYYFPKLEFWIRDILNDSNSVNYKPESGIKAQKVKWSPIWAFRATSGTYMTWFESFKISQFQNSSSGKYWGLAAGGNELLKLG